MSRYINVEPLKAKIKSLAEEITRLLAENEKLKKDLEYYHTGTDICDMESARLAGQNEAWELARKITCQPINGGFKRSDFEEIFGDSYISDIFKKYTYSKAATKVEEWEKTKEEIKVGDIVRCKSDTPVEFCVTEISCYGRLYGIGRNGGTYRNKNPKDWEKTGRHIDIDSFLKQIGGAE